MDLIYNFFNKILLKLNLGKKITKDSFKLNYELDLNKFNDDWRVGLPWGSTDIMKPYEWYDNQSVGLDEDEIILSTKYAPKRIDGVMYSYSVGLVSSQKTFSYGYYEIDALLPEGKFLNPYIGLHTESQEEYSEIIILEGSSDEYSEYDNNFKTTVQSGGADVEYRTIKDNKHSIGKRGLDKHCSYSLLWSPDKLEFYYDGFLVRRVTNQKILEKLNQNPNMMVVLGVGYTNEIIGRQIIKDDSELRIIGVKHYNL